MERTLRNGTLTLALLALPLLAQDPAPPFASDPPAGKREIDFAGQGRRVGGVPYGRDLPAPAGPAPRRVEAGGPRDAAPGEADPHFLAFAAGRYYPAPGERIDPGWLEALPTPLAEGRPQDVTWAYALLAQRLQPGDVASIESRGARVLGLFPHQALVLRVPVGALQEIAEHPAVHWLGLPRPWQKLEPSLEALLGEEGAAGSDPLLDLFVNVFESDLGAASLATPVGSVLEVAPGGRSTLGNADALPLSWRTHGWQEQALERRGARVASWSESIRAFRVALPASRVREVAALDFVRYVELDRPVRLLHEESIPMIAGDLTRQDFPGNQSGQVSIGIVDSGLHTAHGGLDHLFAVGWDFSGDVLQDPFIDLCGHGSHVAGTFFGNGSIEPTYQGMAPQVGWTNLARVFNVKIFDSFCAGNSLDIEDVFDVLHSPYFDSQGEFSPPPQVINHSWGSDVLPFFWIGTEARARAFDQEVYDHRQLHVLSVGNDGPGFSTMGIEAAAKNVLSVGNVVPFPAPTGDPGWIAMGSSRGPCGDGRFKPNVAAPGTQILSIEAPSVAGYDFKSGTSMAAPHVAGLAAQLVDHYPLLGDQPHALSALLMATAVPRSEAVISTPQTSVGHHLNNYGAGRVESFRSHWADADSATYLWIFDQDFVSWQELDFPVEPGAQRIVSVMTYLEPAAGAGAAQALLADLDTWIDAEPFAAGGPSGDFSNHQSSVDNIEIATILTPAPGDWRVKVVPATFFLNPIPVAVCVTIDYGATHPATTLEFDADKLCAEPNELVLLTARVAAPTFVSSALFALVFKDGGTLHAASTVMPGAGPANHMDNTSLGNGVLLGDVVHGEPREVHWLLSWPTEGIKQPGVVTQSENTDDLSAILSITIDGTPPGAPQNLASPTHPPGVWSNAPSIIYTWDPAVDELSQIAGYSIASGPAPSTPDTTIDLPGDATTTSEPAVESDGSWFFSIRAADACGHFGPHAAIGPMLVDLTRPTGPTNVDSTTHTLGVPSLQTAATVVWDTASDNLSGLAGYQAVWSQAPTHPLTGPINLSSAATSISANLSASSEPWYLHLVAFDVAGNRGVPIHFGPLPIYPEAGTPFCAGDGSGTACPCGNSGGPGRGCGNSVDPLGARLMVSGIASLAFDSALLRGTNMPNQPILYFQGTQPVAGGAGVVFGDGLRCVGGSTRRLGATVNQNGHSEFPGTGDPPLHVAGGIVTAGVKLYYQAWYRDPSAVCSGSGFNLTNAAEILWLP